MKNLTHYQSIIFKNLKPNIHETVYIASGAVIAGDVNISENSSIWFNSVVRGDVARIIIGKNTNIQDGCVIHTSRFENGSTYIGDNVTVGHMALIHACRIENNAFVGMNSTIMDSSIIEEYGFIGAGSLLPAGKIIKKKELWVGRPAKFIRNITESELSFMQDNVKQYIDLAKEYKRNQSN
jgi:gamma-carbonic anhydrase